MTSISFGTDNSGTQVGINNGPVYLSSERPKPRLEPLSMLPFPPDPDFVRRDTLSRKIHSNALIPGSRTVLVGLGGVGKTQLAIEYCHQVRERSRDIWVFWVHASNAARCEKSLRDLANRAKIPGHQDRNANIFQLVGTWLQDEGIGKWILVLDNVDDDDLLRKPLETIAGSQTDVQTMALAQPPLRYLFETSKGSIIVTSRSKKVALAIANHRNVIEVQPMDEGEAIDLLQRRLSLPTEHKYKAQLVKALEFMPLAIVQAAGYITHHSPRCSVSDYLEKIQKSDRNTVRLLNHEAGLLYRDWEAKNSILLTWQISFDYIRKMRPSAVALLSLMSLFDRQGIHDSILRVQQNQENDNESRSVRIMDSSSENEDSSSESGEDETFENDVTTLSDYSFISIGESHRVLTMHRLVQLTVRTWLKTNDQLEQWKEKFINILHSHFPTGQYENWEICRALFPHVRSAMLQRPESKASLQQWTTLLYRGAWYAQETGNIAESREMATLSRKYRLKMFGAEDEGTLDCAAILAVAYRLEGRWKEAEQLEVQVMETSKAKLGEDHPDTLTSMAHLASTYWNQGRWEEAERILVQVMGTRRTKLGGDHPSTLTSMANLASTYSKQGWWEEAERLEVLVVGTRKMKLGEDHPSTLTSMANLASTYRNQGRWEEAERLDMQVMETSKTKLGEDHPHTLSSMANLASTYGKQGRWKEAERLEVLVMETRKMKLGEDHPSTLISMANLASTYWNQGRWEEAEELEVQVVEICKVKLGEDHPHTLSSMANLAFTYESRGTYVKAIHLLRSCVAKQQKILGSAHPDTLSNSEILLEWETRQLALKA